MTTDNFCFYLQNRLIQTSQTGGQRYSDTSPFSIPWLRQRTQPGIKLGICRPAAVAQVVQHRPTNHEILGSNPGTAWQLDASSPALLIIL